MGNTQAKLSAVPQQSRRNANCNTRKRRASPAPLDTNNKRCAIALKAEDTDHTREDLPNVPDAKKPCGPLRDSLDADEQFLELPQLFDLVGIVAKKHGGKEAWHEMFVLGREREKNDQWLNVSYHLDTQIPHIILRISAPSMRNSEGRYEPVYVYIFATNLAQAPHKPIRIKTGKDVNISQKRTKRLRHTRPRLLNKTNEGRLTETSLQFCRLDKGQMDVEGRASRPVIVGKVSRTDLDRMTAEVVAGKPDQPAHEKLLGLIQSDKIREGLDLYTEYDGDNLGYEYVREAHFCRLFRLAMILCHELGNLWAYRLQFPDISWTDKDFPFDKLQPPRWTVRKWFARADEKSSGQAAVAALPAQWEAISRPKVLPGAEEELFLRGLDAVEGDPSSRRVFVRKDFDAAACDPKAIAK